MLVENRIIEKCLFFIFFNIEKCRINTYFKSYAPHLQQVKNNPTSSPSLSDPKSDCHLSILWNGRPIKHYIIEAYHIRFGVSLIGIEFNLCISL